MKLWSSFLGFFAGVFAILTLWVGYGVSYSLHHETRVTDAEVVIGRVTTFGRSETYIVDKESGDQRLITRRHIPFFADEYAEIAYSTKCKCVETVSRYTGDSKIYASRHNDGTVYWSAGTKYKLGKSIPFGPEQQHVFGEAEAELDMVRARYAHLVQPK